MEELKSQKVADQQEILELLTAIARGETISATLRGIGEGAQTIDEDLPPTTAERINRLSWELYLALDVRHIFSIS
ncbi:hypothetical protein [Lysinibacillus capsici]|uniref:hypothetical protein n=1 Tax=Lysinibacillus capsici TaxID=2115968 RepID=UPI0032E38B3F